MTIQALSVQVRKRVENFQLDVSCAIALGINVLFGPSGAGKSTLLDCIAGLLKPDSGRIAINDIVFFDGERGVNLATHRRKIGYVFQDLALFPHLSVERNLLYGLEGGDAAKDEVQEILASFQIDHLRARKPRQLSGGERQRVALARALVTGPRVLMLDEPLAALDAISKSKIIADLRAWNQSHSIPIIYVTHSREEVFALGEQVLIINDGRITAQGTPHQVMAAPRQETVAQLAGFENILDATVLTLNEDRGTMTCQVSRSILLETPLMRAAVGETLRVGIRAGDILLATSRPEGLSARNIFPGKISSLDRRDTTIVAQIDCGESVVSGADKIDGQSPRLEVHLTLSARDSLGLEPGRAVWLVIKTYSCHLMSVG